MEHRFPWRWSLADLSRARAGRPYRVHSFLPAAGGRRWATRGRSLRVLLCEIDAEIFRVCAPEPAPEMGYVMDVREFAALAHYPEALGASRCWTAGPVLDVQYGGRQGEGVGRRAVRRGQEEAAPGRPFFAFLDVAERLRRRSWWPRTWRASSWGRRGLRLQDRARMRGLDYPTQLFVLDAWRMGVRRRGAAVSWSRTAWGGRPSAWSSTSAP